MGSLIATLTPQQVKRALDAGSILIDLRPHAEFAAAHICKSINIMFSRKSLPERVATAIPPGPTVLLLSRDPAQGDAAAAALTDTQRNPFGGIAGCGIEAWRAAGLPLTTLSQLSVSTLRDRLADPEDHLVLIDCRESFEWELGHIKEALLIPLGEIWRRADDLDASREIVLLCEEGIRSSTGASILLHRGFPRAANVPGGMGDWFKAGYPTVRLPKRPRS